MMKFLILAAILILTNTSTLCQINPFWGNLEKGEYEVGYKDTFLLKANETYQVNNYKGGKPFFIRTWYPSKSTSTKPVMVYNDFFEVFESNLDTNLIPIQDTMMNHYRKAVIWSGIKQNLSNWEYEDIREELIDSILNTELYSKRGIRIAEGKFPCLVYHHGAGGFSFENHVLFEYLASHGWIIISSNYHWYIENRNRLGNNYDIEGHSPTTDILFILDYVKNKSNIIQNKLVYAGHSWGGQQAFYTNAIAEQTFSLYLIYDTTWETKKWNKKFKEKHLKYTRIVEEKELSKPNTAPMVLFTSPKKSLVFGKPKYTNPSFEVFKKLNSKSLTYISCKAGINHESFISLGTCRASYPSSNSFRDGETLHKEFVQFQKITRLTLDLLKNHVNSNSTIPIQKIHEKDFLIENCNLCITTNKKR